MTVRGRGDLQLVVALAAALALGCEKPNPDDAPWARAKSASYASDSAQIVALARHALGDSLELRVETIAKGSQGWFVRLLPVRGGLPGGGTVYVQPNDSSATVVKRY
ncbi:MAG TPA: hypothetical protein VHM30_13890 [Gemmatimonadaceae bacterium]|nr:hypothetical protein [Gemmatimonadaceae bacterium]